MSHPPRTVHVVTTELLRTGLATRLAEGLETLRAVLAELDVATLHGDDARRLAEMFAQAGRLCEAGLTVTAARVAETGSWQSDGQPSPEAWVARTTRRSTTSARRTLETGRRVLRQPEVRAHLQAGALSTEQAEEISAAATEAPAATRALLEQARSDASLTALRSACRNARAGASSEADERARHRRIHASRSLRAWTDTDGAGRIDGRMTADSLARLMAHLQPFGDREFERARLEGRRERFEAYSLDALLAMAEASASDADEPDGDLDTPVASLDGRRAEWGDADDAGASQARCDGVGSIDDSDVGARGSPASADGSRRSSADTCRSRRVRAPATVLIRVDLPALRRGWSEAGEQCEIDGIGPVPVAVVREWTHDAFMALVVTDGVDVRSVVHLGRFATAAQRSALLVRDPECVVPGCHVRSRLEIDHVDPWESSHVTTLDRLARLCHPHHQMKTHQGWTLGGRPGSWSWDPPRGRQSGTEPSDPFECSASFGSSPISGIGELFGEGGDDPFPP
jgi:hypothetical protein